MKRLTFSNLIFILFFHVQFISSQNEIKLRIFNPEKNLPLLASQGLLDCGMLFKKGCCVQGHFPEEITHLLPKEEFEIIHEKDISLSKSNSESCNKIRLPSVNNFQTGTMGGFYTLEEVDTQFARMRQLFPQLISSKIQIQGISSHEGRPLYYYRISDNPDIDEHESAIFYGAAIHAREPISVSQLVYFAWYLLENAASHQDLQFLINNTEIYIMPVINPDGYYFNQVTNPNGGGMWRKNRRNNGNGTVGVDLNRNFPFNWGFDDLGSSPDPASSNYRGPGPLSEPETQALVWLVNQQKCRYVMMHHSYGNLLLFPWGFSGIRCPDSTEFIFKTNEMIRQNGFLSGTILETLSYFANGGSDDYFYGDTSGGRLPSFAVTPETGSWYDGFWPMESRIQSLCHENLWLNLVPLYITFPYLSNNLKLPHLFHKGQIINIPYSLTRISDSNAVFIRKFISLNPMVSIPPEHHVKIINNPPLFNPVIDTLVFHVSNNLTQTHTTQIVLELHNGLFPVLDTFIIHVGHLDTLLFTTCDVASTENFSSITWNYSAEKFKSPPTSLTDSPFSFYPPNASGETFQICFDKVIDLSNIEHAELSYFAQWDLEKGFDFVTPFALLPDGSEVTLCGYHTFPIFTPPDVLPAYDGSQYFWVPEYISLNHLSGEKFQICFSLQSDANTEKDGFYVDDISVRFLNLNTMNASNSAYKNFTLYPNPASTTVSLYVNEGLQIFDIKIMTPEGRLVFNEKYLNTFPISMDVSFLSPGIYFIKIEGKIHKLIIQ